VTIHAYVTAPPTARGTGGRELAAALESLGVTVVLAEAPANAVEALMAQGATAVDAACDAVDARAAVIARSDLLVAVLDGQHPDVLVDIGMAYASGTDCYGLHLDGRTPHGLHTMMLDGHCRSIPDLLTLLRRHLRLDTAGHREEVHTTSSVPAIR
jgi:hypothetical protein